MKTKILSLVFAGCMGASVFTSCDKYVDITPLGALTVDSAYTYYELVSNPMRCYYPSSFAYLTDELWPKESKIIGYESSTTDGINFTFNEKAERSLLSDNNLYENMYSDILRCNLIIDNINLVPGTEEIKRLGMAEARVYRAWNHFLAVNTFAKAYTPSTAATDGGVCIMNHYDLEAMPEKSSVEDVYSFVIKELEEAVPSLQEKPLNIYHPSLAYGYGLLSQVYLFHRDWKKAAEAANRCLQLNGSIVDYNVIDENGGVARYREYADDKNPEVLSYMWLAGGWTSENATYYNYGVISPELVELYGDNDLRYSLFFRQSGTTIDNYYDKGSGSAIWTPATTTARFTYMAVGMRTPEVYLNLAEAQARMNDIEASTNTINKLRVNRISGSDKKIAQPSTQHDMMEQVILERRKELLFGFHRFFDLKRYNTEAEYAKTITHTFPIVSTSVPQQTYTLAPDSRLYIIPFPHSARDKNPNLTLNTDEK